MRYLLIVAGWICVGLGILGAFLPLLPTTPFILLASYLFYRSSPWSREWLLKNRYFGRLIRNYQIYKAIPLRTKIYSITLLWVTIISSIYLLRDRLILQILLGLIATAVTIHISTFKTLRKD